MFNILTNRPEGSALGVYHYVIELTREGGFTDQELSRIEEAGHMECLGSYACMEG